MTKSADQFAELLEPCRERLYAYVFAFLHDAADTQDVLQQTFIVLWEKFDTFDRDTDFFRWALVTAKYEAFNYIRFRQRYRARFSEAFMEKLSNEKALVTLEGEDERKKALKSCLTKLSDSDRRLLRSRYENNLKVVQIADILNRSQPSISNTFRRIRAALRECIERSLSQECES